MSQDNYGLWVKRANLAAVSVAGVLIAVKLWAWLATDSVSLLASLTDSLMDACASLITLLAVRYALTPADEEHSFGHGKAESLAGLAQAAFISGSALVLMMNGIASVISPRALPTLAVGIWISLGSMLLTLALLGFQSWVIKQTDSVAIKADRLHYRADVLLNGSVIVALLLADYGMMWVDGVFAIGIGLSLFAGALKIGYDAVHALLDRALPTQDQLAIVALCHQIEGVQGVHEVRTRQAGPLRFVQLHLELDDNLTLLCAHAIAEQAEQAILAQFERIEVIIHLDPISSVAPDIQRLGQH